MISGSALCNYCNFFSNLSFRFTLLISLFFFVSVRFVTPDDTDFAIILDKNHERKRKKKRKKKKTNKKIRKQIANKEIVWSAIALSSY